MGAGQQLTRVENESCSTAAGTRRGESRAYAYWEMRSSEQTQFGDVPTIQAWPPKGPEKRPGRSAHLPHHQHHNPRQRPCEEVPSWG